MKHLYLILTLFLLISCGCSSAQTPVTVDEENAVAQAEFQSSRNWTWDVGLYHVSADHRSIERIPQRASDYHLNVTPFVEPPKCAHCIVFGKPQIQPDGTLKVKIRLNHPFPGAPQYTGFDVHGTVMFPATRYWESNLGVSSVYWYKYTDNLPLNFSRAEDGGGQLLNADGFTFYLFPGLDLGPEFSQPIFNYSRGERANGLNPDSTINGFKLFTNDPERRMFRTYDTITRTYHIDPPDGEFFFGYVVDACWVQPTTTPVTDPAVDFPTYANCEEGYVLETVQLQPFKTGGAFERYELINTTVLNYPDVEMGSVGSAIYCPDISPTDFVAAWGIAHSGCCPGPGPDWEEISPGVFEVLLCTDIVPPTFTAPPGEYLALVITSTFNYWIPTPPTGRQVMGPPLFDFITLEVVQGE